MTDITSIAEGMEQSDSKKKEKNPDIWQVLNHTNNPEEYATAWLNIQCSRLENVNRAIVVFGTPDRGPFSPIAVWPEAATGSPRILTAIESVIATKSSCILNTEDAEVVNSDNVIATPILVDNRIAGVVAIEIAQADNAQQQKTLKDLEWGLVWMQMLVRRGRLTPTDRLVTVLELLATSLHHERFQEAATAVVTELANIFGCERVCIGFLKGKHAEVKALSHSAQVGKKANVIQNIESAMDESIDQHTTIVYPVLKNSPIQVVRLHEELHKKHGENAICTVPYTDGNHIIGAFTLERPIDQLFDADTVKLLEHATSLLGQILNVKRKEDRWLIGKVGSSFKTNLRKLIGRKHMAFKLVFYSLFSIIVFLSIADGKYRITSDATLEGTVQRVISAPMAGYLASQHVRAGDIVKEGEVLFTLDEHDLRLEKLKWESQRSQRVREYTEASAEHDRAKSLILNAQIKQANAQISLVDEQLKRTQVLSPFDGIVVSGDLSQSLGAPVERGDILFEVSPLNSYRVILNVDETEISNIRHNQTGILVLAAAPDKKIPIIIEKITPVSSAEEGKNFFRVEAKLESSYKDNLRPGMQGIGKISVDDRKLIWIWTYKITHWMRMFFWTWLP